MLRSNALFITLLTPYATELKCRYNYLLTCAWFANKLADRGRRSNNCEMYKYLERILGIRKFEITALGDDLDDSTWSDVGAALEDSDDDEENEDEDEDTGDEHEDEETDKENSDDEPENEEEI